MAHGKSGSGLAGVADGTGGSGDVGAYRALPKPHQAAWGALKEGFDRICDKHPSIARGGQKRPRGPASKQLGDIDAVSMLGEVLGDVKQRTNSKDRPPVREGRAVAPRATMDLMWARTLGAMLVLVGCAASAPLPTTPSEPVVVPAPDARDAQVAPAPLAAVPPLVDLPEASPIPSGADDALRATWARLFALGFLDPRVGTPHRVQIADSSVWSTDLETREAVGFVFPAGPGQRPYALVGVLVYPVESIGAEVDLAATCRATLDALDVLGPEPADGAERFEWFERVDAAWADCPGIFAALFLASTHVELVNDLRAGHRAAEQTYAAFLSAWVRSSFERAVTAHMRGDDLLARHDAHQVVRLLPTLRDALTAVGDGFELGNLGYLDAADALARDQDRRAAAGPRAPLPTMPPGEVSADLVPVLIEHLDDVFAPQLGQPGGVDFRNSPIVQALIRAGDAAVPPLLDVLEHDTRLTRSVHFFRDFVPPRSVLAVHEAAYAALIEILGVSFFHPAATGDDLTSRGDGPRAQLAAQMRAFWERYGRWSPAERRYRILAADDESRDRHVEAAMWLTAAADATATVQGSMVQPVWFFPPHGPLAGEPMRSRRQPSVTDLLVRRMEESEVAGLGCSFAHALSIWTPSEAPSLMRSFAHRCVSSGMCGCAPTLVEIVGEQEPSILDDYARWLRGNRDVDRYTYEPIARFAAAPAIQAAIEWLFREGPFAPTAVGWGARRNIAVLVESGMFEVPLVRERLADALRHQDAVGTLTSDRDGNSMVVRDGGSFSVRLPEPATEPRTVRIGDLYADAVADRVGVPFSLGWERARRDAAIEAMRAQLLHR